MAFEGKKSRKSVGHIAAEKEVKTVPMKPVNFNAPKQLHTDFKKRVIDNEENMTDVFIQFMRDYISKEIKIKRNSEM